MALSNITFQMDGNMTFIPPSPIAETENVTRLYDEVSKCPFYLLFPTFLHFKGLP